MGAIRHAGVVQMAGRVEARHGCAAPLVKEKTITELGGPAPEQIVAQGEDRRGDRVLPLSGHDHIPAAIGEGGKIKRPVESVPVGKRLAAFPVCAADFIERSQVDHPRRRGAVQLEGRLQHRGLGARGFVTELVHQNFQGRRPLHRDARPGQAKAFARSGFDPELNLVAAEWAGRRQFVESPAILVAGARDGLVHPQHHRRAPALASGPDQRSLAELYIQVTQTLNQETHGGSCRLPF